MTLIYHYTPGVNAAGTSGPFDTGRAGVEQVATPTTRQEMFNAIVEALGGVTGAGWTESSASTASNHIYTSLGESGNENITITLTQGLRGSPDARYIQFGLAHSTDVGGNAINPVNFGVTTATNSIIDLGNSDFTMEFQILASLDFIWVFINRQSNNVPYTLFCGRLNRRGYNENVLTVDAAGAVPGTNVLIPTTTNPIIAGFRIGDNLTALDQNVGLSVAENVLVVDVESGGIRVQSLGNNLTSGSRIGAQPNPLVVGHWSGSSNFDDTVNAVSTTNWRSLYRFSTPGEPELETDDGDGNSNILYARPLIIGSARVLGTVEQGLGSSSTPERRTNRFLCPANVLMSGASYTSGSTAAPVVGPNPGKNILGMLPSFYAYPGSVSYFPHDNFVRTRNVVAIEDYVPVRFSTSTDENHMIGPIPP